MERESRAFRNKFCGTLRQEPAVAKISLLFAEAIEIPLMKQRKLRKRRE